LPESCNCLLLWAHCDYSLTENTLNLVFTDAKVGFIGAKTLDLNISEMLRYCGARSKVSNDAKIAMTFILDAVKAMPAEEISLGKDFLKLFSVCLCRHYKVCNYGECSPEMLGRIVRIATTLARLRGFACG
jgi:hypothetical protein